MMLDFKIISATIDV